MTIPTEPIASIARPRALAEIRDRVLEAGGYVPVERRCTTDDCGVASSCDDSSTTRDVALAKIQARVRGTALAAELTRGR
jgi:5-methyltetrahydropteroyltriglutamate--homocysteine methyltransferase